MEYKLLLLKTLFCCSACDGEIAPEEVALVKSLAENDTRFSDMDIEAVLYGFIAEINASGKVFLKKYLNELAETKLSDEEQVSLIDLAIKMIEADNQVLYSEVKFFKKLRACLSVSDEAILNVLPEKEEYLLPDVKSSELVFDEDLKFAEIDFKSLKID